MKMKCIYTVIICMCYTCVASTSCNENVTRGRQERSRGNSINDISIPTVTRKNLLFGVLLPSDEYMPDGPTMKGVLPAMMLAIDNIVAPDGILPGFNISLEYRDTQCSSTLGPLAAFDIINRGRRPDVFFGPICQYVLAPVSRYASVWDIPIVTAGGFPDAFLNKTLYPMTRILGSYKDVSLAALDVLREFKWNVASLLYHNHEMSTNKGHSDCYFALSGINVLLKTPGTSQHFFDQEIVNRTQLIGLLEKIKIRSRMEIFTNNPILGFFLQENVFHFFIQVHF